MSVLVLGSSGLVGRRLVARLATEGRTVVACDVVGPTAAPIAGVSYVQVDITRLDRILSVIAEHQVEQIALLSYIMGPLMSPLHSDILLACDVNVSGVANVLEAARLGGVRRLAFLSTVGVYGPQEMYGDRTVVEDERLAPTSLYGRMKLLNESICDRYAALYGLEVVKVRPSSILGSGSTIWPSRFIERVAVGETGLVPYGEPGRDNVIAVDDLTALLSLLLHGPTPAHSTYLASGHNVTMGELVEVVRTLIPGSAIEFPTPERRPTYPQWFDNRRAVEEFGWKVSSLVDSVRTYVNGVRADAGLASLPAS